MRLRRGADRGTAAVLVLVIVAVVAVMAVALAEAGRGLIDRQQAQAAADAVALAGAGGGRPAADDVARANNATIVAYSDDGTTVAVTVRVGEATASARATGGDRAVTSRVTEARPSDGGRSLHSVR